MKRAIVVPAPMPSAARDDLKSWLAITSSNEDALLDSLLRTAFDMCEGFTGCMVLAQTCEEYVPAGSGWQVLGARPVRAIEVVSAIGADGPAVALGATDYELDIDADQVGRVRLLSQGNAVRLLVRFEAGLAETWDLVPEGLRQGVIRLAAYHFRERDGAATTPPASVAALWRPWRRLRLA